MTFIDGYSGSFGNQTAIARGLNSGLKVANAMKNDPNSLNNADIQYTTLENGKLSLKGGLAFGAASLLGIDQNNDGRIQLQEAGQLGTLLDLNNDGVVSAGENLAFTMYQDSTSNLDGVVTSQEAQKSLQQIQADPNKARADLAKLYLGNGINNAEGVKSSSVTTTLPTTANPTNSFTDMLQKLLASIGGQTANGTTATNAASTTPAATSTTPTNTSSTPTSTSSSNNSSVSPQIQQMMQMFEAMMQMLQQMMQVFKNIISGATSSTNNNTNSTNTNNTFSSNLNSNYYANLNNNSNSTYSL